MPLLPRHTTEASAQPAWRLGVKTFLQTAGLWALFLGLIPWGISQAERRSLGWSLPAVNPLLCWSVFWGLALGGFYCGRLFVVYGKGTPLPMETARHFVVLGPYRYLRNPMATFGIGQGIVVGFLFRSPSVILFSLLGGLAWHLFARPWEERDLLERFGEPYAEYRRAVHNWIPRWPPYPKIVPSDDTSSRADTA